MKIVDKGSVNITAGEVNKNVLLKAKNQTLAQFTVKPADGASSVEIETIQFALSNSNSSEGINSDDIRIFLCIFLEYLSCPILRKVIRNYQFKFVMRLL